MIALARFSVRPAEVAAWPAGLGDLSFSVWCHDPSRNSTALSLFARPKTRISFERGLTRFRPSLFHVIDPSQKRPFLRGGSGDAKILQTVLKRGIRRRWQYQSANEMGC